MSQKKKKKNYPKNNSFYTYLTPKTQEHPQSISNYVDISYPKATTIQSPIYYYSPEEYEKQSSVILQRHVAEYQVQSHIFHDSIQAIPQNYLKNWESQTFENSKLSSMPQSNRRDIQYNLDSIYDDHGFSHNII